ncbi:cell wall-binding repeat-containing protein [Peptoclostridium sp. AF21-18]|uniref:cell wall-binding repeat-containing protein n=1 Tax=Peptoclostridium sp. AF21-18 TaxID=2292243 RepID=UPI0013144B88|nr:cell wall-binding repeat-containing protein [Peptoclostridium sp. AF21-18]
MKKKLLSIFLSLSLIFSSIASMSVSFAEENSSTEKVIQQDGIEVRMDMKAGSSLYMKKYHWLKNPNPSWKEYFEDEYTNSSAELKNYNKNQLMKIVIEVPKKEGLVINNINHEQNDSVPDSIKQNFPEYFGWQENDKGNNQYNFYFRDSEDKDYKFTIEYTYNGKTSTMDISYPVKDLLDMDMNFRAEIMSVMFNAPMGYSTKDKYLTKNILGDESKWPKKMLIQKESGGFKYNAHEIKTLNGIQYLGNNIKQLLLSWEAETSEDAKNGKNGFTNLKEKDLEIISLAEKDYENLDQFRITEHNMEKPTIPENSYSPEILAKCVEKMPNLQGFYCEGSGFNNFKVFEGLEGNKLDDIWCGNNGVTSIEGIEKHNLNHIGIHNTTAGKNVGLPQNGVFDLTPLKNSDLGAKCSAVLQEIDFRKVMENKGYKDYKVLAVKDNDKVKIELPMPIDINGALTDVTNNEVIAKYGNETIKCTANENNGKKYIEIDNTIFGGKVVEDIENIEFNFNFNNDSGVDERTKGLFNGVVNFKASFTSPTNPSTKEYGVLYKFVSGTRGKELPPAVEGLLPIDGNNYVEGQKITAIQPTKTTVTVEDGEWRFEGYDADEKIANEANDSDKDGNIAFSGTWNFYKKVEKATVKYEAKNTSTNRDDGNVDKNILDVKNIKVSDYVNLPKDEKEYNVGESVTPKNPTTTKKINEDGEETGVSTEIKPGESILVKYEVPNTNNVETYIKLTFEGYEPETLNVQVGENKFVGKFSFEDMELVHYDFISEDGKQIPKNIEEKIEDEFEKFKEYELYPDGEDVILKQPKNKTIKDTDGTWEFTGWAYKKEDGKYEYVKNNEKEVHHDEELKGVWKFVKDSSGGGTGGGGTPTPNPDKEDPDRVEGDDRIETSIEASEILYPNGTNAVVLANAERFSDVLTANPFAVQEKASALLTYKDKLPEKTLKEIERLGAKKIYVSGGYEAVSKKVVDSLAAKGYEIYRFDGLDRYDTARKIAIKIREKGNKEVVELASGENYPDALCMTSMAVKDNAPILLTRKDSIPKYTKQALAEWDIESVKIGGLDEAISKDVQNQIDKGFEITKGNKADSNVYDGAKKVSRFGGKDRYETSTIIAANSYPESKLGVYATGEDFPDALIAGNYAGRKEAPVLLVKRDTLPEVVEKYTTDSKIEKATVIGGVNAVSDKVFNLIKAAINK